MTPTELKATLKAASGAYVVPEGDYGALSLSGLRDVAVDAGAARFRSLSLSACEGVTWSGSVVTLAGLVSSSTSAVRMTGCRDVTLKGVEAHGAVVEGLPSGRPFYIERSSGVLLEDCRGSIGFKGLVLYLVGDVTVRGCDFGHVRTGTLSGSALSGPVLIEDNYLHDSNPVNYGGAGDHGDFLHLWTDARAQTAPTVGVTIRGNLLDRGDGFPIMGIYLDDNGAGIGFRKVLIEGNTILTGHGHGILLENTEASVRNNTLLQNGSYRGDNPKDAPAIHLKDGSVVQLSGNMAADPEGLFAKYPGNLALPLGIRPAGELALARWMARRR